MSSLSKNMENLNNIMKNLDIADTGVEHVRRNFIGHLYEPDEVDDARYIGNLLQDLNELERALYWIRDTMSDLHVQALKEKEEEL